MKLLVLGAGAIGGYFGGRLAQAGCDVTFLVRPGRQAQIEREGLRIESPLGNAQIAAKTLLAPALHSEFVGGGASPPRYDLILFTCKAYDLDAAMDAVAPAMEDGAALVPLLNGIAHYERLDARFGAQNVIGGTAQISVTLHKDGVVSHTGNLQRIAFGERDRKPSERTQSLADAFARTQIEWKLSDDIVQELWEKIVFLAALAETTCLFRANVGEIMASPGGRGAMELALAANVAIATREGHAPRPAAIEFARKGLTQEGGAWSASMLRDIEAGNDVEADHIVGYMLNKAREHGIEEDLLALAYTHLKAYQARRAAGRLPRS